MKLQQSDDNIQEFSDSVKDWEEVQMRFFAIVVKFDGTKPFSQ
jgi:hypothetical protein